MRSKNNVKGDNEFFYRFMYHDISILFTYFKNFKIKSVNINRSIKKRIFKINILFKNNKTFLFEYSLSSKIKNHYINNVNYITKIDILKKMLKSVLYGKVNISDNNQKALFILKFLNKMKRYS